jgi:hypothetical protein
MMPDEVLARWDSQDPTRWSDRPSLGELAEALRAALDERNEARRDKICCNKPNNCTEPCHPRGVHDGRLAGLREAQAYIMRQSQEIYGVFLLEHQETSCWVQDLIDRETEKAAQAAQPI